jgi:hypothetical protein
MFGGVFALKPTRNIATGRPLTSYIVGNNRHEESIPISRSEAAGAPPRTRQGRSPETPAPFPLRHHVAERSSLSRVRSAAQKRRALDNSGPFWEQNLDKGKGGLRVVRRRVRLPMVGPQHFVDGDGAKKIFKEGRQVVLDLKAFSWKDGG